MSIIYIGQRADTTMTFRQQPLAFAAFQRLVFHGDQVYLYTNQLQKRITYNLLSNRRLAVIDLHLGLWAFNANSAEPLFRKRLSSERDGSPPPLPAKDEVPLLRDTQTFKALDSLSPRRRWTARLDGNTDSDSPPSFPAKPHSFSSASSLPSGPCGNCSSPSIEPPAASIALIWHRRDTS